MAKLYFYYSAMNAGKSTLLLQSAYNYQERGMNTVIYIPEIDTRSGKNTVKSRIGLQQKAVGIGKTFDFYADVKKRILNKEKLACVLVDESQFLSKAQVYQLAKVVDQCNLPVLAYGIRTDFAAEPFEGSVYLLALADNLVEVKTICHCGKKAIMNMRVDGFGNQITKGEQVDIGGNEKYIATCRHHFYQGDSGKLETAELTADAET